MRLNVELRIYMGLKFCRCLSMKWFARLNVCEDQIFYIKIFWSVLVFNMFARMIFAIFLKCEFVGLCQGISLIKCIGWDTIYVFPPCSSRESLFDNVLSVCLESIPSVCLSGVHSITLSFLKCNYIVSELCIMFVIDIKMLMLAI